METQCDGLDQATLRQLLLDTLAKHKSETDATKLEELNTQIGIIKKHLKLAVNADKEAEVEATLNLTESKITSSEKQTAHRELQATISKLPKYAPGMDVHVHLNKLTNLYELYVRDRDDATKLEETFVRNAKTQLHDAYLTQLTNSSETVDTYEDFKAYMIKHHQSKETHFQQLNKLWQLEPRESENYVDFAARLENTAHEIQMGIVNKWKKENNVTTDMTSKAVFDMITSQILIQHIQASHKDCYRFIANDLDKDWTAKEVANRAKTTLDRVKSESLESPSYVAEVEPQWSDSPMPHTGGGGNNKKKSTRRDNKKKKKVTPNKNSDCWFFLDGKCKKGDNCPWKHDPAKFGTGRPEAEVSSLVTLPSFRNWPVRGQLTVSAIQLAIPVL